MALRNKATGAKAAIYDTASGDAPFGDPAGNIAKVRFDSDLDYLRGTFVVLGATVNHAAVAGVTGTGMLGAPVDPSAGGSSGPASAVANGQVVTATHLLYTHGLGVTPRYQVMYNGEVVNGGTLVQADDTARWRLVSSYADATGIYLFEVGMSSAAALSAASRDYDVVVFKDPAADPGKPQMLLSPGRVIYGQGKLDTDDRMLRLTGVGDPTFQIPLGPTSDIGNGGIRIGNSGGLSDFNGYSGSFAAPAFLGLTMGAPGGAGPATAVTMAAGRTFGTKSGSYYLDTSLPMLRFFPAASEVNWSGSIGFTEPPHDNAYAYSRGLIGASVYGGCRSSASLLNQEWEDITTIGTVPAGTDFLYVTINATRTTVPSQINGITIPVLFAQGKWVNAPGGTLHFEFGGILQRKIDVYLDGTNVKLRRKQSIKDTTYTFWRAGNDPNNSGWTYGTSPKGHIVAQIDVKGPAFDPSGISYRRGAGTGCSLVDPTAYASAYDAIINVRPGRYQS